MIISFFEGNNITFINAMNNIWKPPWIIYSVICDAGKMWQGFDRLISCNVLGKQISGLISWCARVVKLLYLLLFFPRLCPLFPYHPKECLMLASQLGLVLILSPCKKIIFNPSMLHAISKSPLPLRLHSVGRKTFSV